MTASGARVPRVTTRAGLEADALDVGAIVERARKELAPLRGGTLLVGDAVGDAVGLPAHKWLAEVLGDDRRRLAVGAIDGAVVGAGLARLGRLDCPGRLDRPEPLGDSDRSVGGGSLATIDLLYVVPEARGVGVGEAVLDDLLRWCAERGCAGVDVPALPGARETKNFLEAAHFSARLLVMHRRLPL